MKFLPLSVIDATGQEVAAICDEFGRIVRENT